MEDNEELKQKTVSNLLWKFAERAGTQIISLIISIVLARILSPEDYGVIALVTIFIAISQVFVDSGLANALIQKKDADDLDFSTVFYFNIIWCIIIYGIIYIVAPFIAEFYNNNQLIDVIRVLGIVIIISALRNVQQAYVSKKMIFKKFFFSTLCGTIFSAVIGIFLAYNGFGIWALVAQQLTNTLIDTLVLWLTVEWRPKKMFSIKRLKGLFSYGWKLLLSYLINTIYDNIRQLVIGKVYSPTDLALYNRGKQIPNVVVTNINSSMDSVLFPVLSEKQENKETIKKMAQKTIRTSCFVIFPLMFGLCATAQPLITVLLTEKWLGATIYLQVFCLIYILEPIQTTNLNVIKALGRTDLFLKQEIIKKILGLIILFCTFKFGVIYILYGMLGYTIIASIINSYPNRKLINYGYIEQLKDISKIIVLSIAMFIVVYLVGSLNFNIIIVLILQIIVGILIYIFGAIILRIDTLKEVLNIVHKLFSKKIKN